MSIFATDFEASLVPLCVERGVRAKIAGWTVPASSGTQAVQTIHVTSPGSIGGNVSGSWTLGDWTGAFDATPTPSGWTVSGTLASITGGGDITCTANDAGSKTPLTWSLASMMVTDGMGTTTAWDGTLGTDAFTDGTAPTTSDETSLAVFCPGVPGCIAWPNIGNFLGNATSVAWSGGDAVSRIEWGWWDGSTFTRIFYIAGSQADGTPDKWADGTFPSPIPAGAVGAALALRIVYDSGSVAANFSGGSFEAIMTMHYFHASS